MTQAQVELPHWAECLWEPCRYVALYGGRGAAKSRSIAAALAIQATEKHHRVLCGREVQKSIRDSSKRLIEDSIRRIGLASAFTFTESEIRGPNESLFLFSGIRGNADAIRSIEGITDFWGEEANSLSAASLDTLTPTIRAPGSRLIFSWNPRDPKDPIDALFRGSNLEEEAKASFSPPPRSIIRMVNFDENPWFPPELQEEMEFDRTRDYDKYRHKWLGEYLANSEARVFKNWKVEAFETNESAEFRLGADFGYSIDPSCALRCYIDGRQLFVDYEAWGLHVEIVNLPALFMSIPNAEKFWMTADSSRPETISHLRNNGFTRIAPALKGPRSIEEGIEFLKSYDLVVHPRCQHLIDELTHYSYKVDSLTGLVTAVLADKDNHLIDALRYAVEGARRAINAKPTFVAAPPPTLALRR